MKHIRRPGPWLDGCKDERLSFLWNEGLSASAIGEALGVSKNAVIGRVRRLELSHRESPIQSNAYRTTSNRLPPKWTEERIAELKVLVERSLSDRHIAAVMGVSRHAVDHQRRKHEFVRPPRPQTWMMKSKKKQPLKIPAPSKPKQQAIAAHGEPATEPYRYDRPFTKCRWIAGDDMPWAACSGQRLPGRSWCAHHLLRVVQPRVMV